MDVRCPKCGTRNTIPDIPNIKYRCGKCSSILIVEPKTESKPLPRTYRDSKLQQLLGRYKMELSLFGLSIIGVLLVVLATSKYGAGMSADALAYTTCAKNLAAGAGYTCHYMSQDNVIYVLWPPLFPTLLAGIVKVGLEPLQGARVLNALAFGMIIFTSGQLFRMFIKSKTLVILATLLILFSGTIFAFSVMALTEPLFTLFGILFAIYLLKFLKEHRLRFLFLTGLFAALSFLQRYMGVAFILAGGIVIISPLLKSPLLQRFKYVIIFGLVAVIPGAVWVIRNLIQTSTITGPRVLVEAPALAHMLYQNIQYPVRVIGAWFLPSSLSSQNVYLVFGSIAVFVFLIAILASIRQRRRTGLDTDFTRAWPMAVILLVYTLWLIASETAVPSESILNPRFLLTIQAFAMLLVFIGIENVLRFLTERWGAKASLQYAAIGICALWVVFGFLRVSNDAINDSRYGCHWNSVLVWESSTMEWLKTNPLSGELYSNAPDHVYFATGISTKFINSLYSNEQSSVTSTNEGNSKYIVLFDKITDESSYDFEELSSTLNLEELTKVSDGAVYLIKDKQANHTFP